MKTSPLTIRDLSRGVYRKSAVSNFLAPPNSVSHAINFNFEKTIGIALVRPGTTLIGATVASNKTPLGLGEYVSSKGTVYNNLVSVFSGASNASVYYYDTSWHTSNLTSLSNTANNRFAMLGNQIFIVNGSDTMRSSSDGGATWGTTNSIDAGGTIKPSLVIRSKARLLVSGDTSQSPSRVFFSSVIDPTATPGSITWNTNSTTGDWIDINPDDGDKNTAFAETSNQVLVFKNNGMYRLDVITKTVDTQNVFNVGAVSQEAVVNCKGVVYFFSGSAIYRTVGDFPEKVSRLGVQDWIDAISQTNWTKVCAGTDDKNVFFSIGNITLNTGQDNQRTFNNVVLKFSTDDESWSVHSYAQQPRFYTKYTDTNGRLMRSADTSGSVQTVDLGTTDNTTAIFYEIETQEQEMGNRAHLKKISDKIVLFSKSGIDSQFQVKEDDGNYKDIPVSIGGSRVYIANDVSLEGYFFTFRFFGNSSNTAPTFEGIYVESIDDVGITNK